MATLEVGSAKSEVIGPGRLPRTGSWNRVVVFDPQNGSVDVRKQRDVQKDLERGKCCLRTRQRIGIDPVQGSKYQRLELPKRSQNVPIFVEKNDDTKIATKQEKDNRFLATLSLDRLGAMNRVLWLAGSLSTLYVSVTSRNAVSQ